MGKRAQAFPLAANVKAEAPSGSLLFSSNVAVGSDRVFITDDEWHCVRVFRKDNGQFMYRFSCEGDDAGKLRYPAGIALWQEFVVVADWGNERVQVFRADGSFVRQLGLDAELNRPTSVHVADVTVENSKCICGQQRTQMRSDESELERPVQSEAASVGVCSGRYTPPTMQTGSRCSIISLACTCTRFRH